VLLLKASSLFRESDEAPQAGSPAVGGFLVANAGRQALLVFQLQDLDTGALLDVRELLQLLLLREMFLESYRFQKFIRKHT
jgi:hypothetical protein